jgi:hypothetical protein
MEMRQFVQPVKEEEEKKRRRVPLLRFIFDVLQVGNYASANVVDSIVDSVEYNRPLGQAAWDAIRAGLRGAASVFTGDEEYKKTFSDIIRQNAEEHGEFLGKTLEEWNEPLQEEYTGDNKLKQLFNKTIGRSTPAGRRGLAGDIFLDPLTYISPLKALKPTGMATTKAHAVASKYAKNALTMKQLGTSFADVKSLVRGGREGLEQVGKKGAASAARQADLFYKGAYKKALTAPKGVSDWGGVLQKEMQQGLKELGDAHLEKTIKELTEQGVDILDIPEGMFREMARPQGMDELAKAIESGYDLAGQRATRISGIGEVGASVRAPNRLARGFDRIGQFLQGKAEKSGLAEAWYSLVNGPSVVGLLKRGLGIRNPYQKLLNMKKMDAENIRTLARNDIVETVDPIVRKLGDDLIQKATDARAIMEQVEFGVLKGQKRAAKVGAGISAALGEGDEVRRVQDILKGVDNWDATIKTLKERGLDASVFEKFKALNLTKEEAEKITEFWTKMDDVFKTMRDKEMVGIEKGLFSVDDMGEWENYIPKIQNRPTFGKKRAGKLISPAEPGFMKETRATYMQSEKQGINFAKEMFGDWIEAKAKATNRLVDDVAKEFVEKNGLAPISTNFVEMLNARITAHARVMGRANLLESLREFGIPVGAMDEMGKTATAAFHRMGNVYADLQQSTDPGLQGLMFDKDVRDIIDKTYGMTASDDTMQGMKKLFMNFTSWWKGMATATTGFHMRNHFSNTITGFFRHGVDWFNPSAYVDAAVGMTYALNPVKFKKILVDQFNIPEKKIDDILSKMVGGRTIKQIAEEARENGVISLKTYIGDVQKEIKPKVDPWKRFDPTKQEFFLPAASRQVGNFVENHARFHSYMLTLKDMSKAGVADDAAREFAKIDTKKWFLDYGDLSEVEQKYLKNVIPFYTFTRKNLANQVSGLMLMPDMYRLAAKAEESVSIDEFDYTLVPEYMKQLGYLPVSRGEKGPIMWWPNFPYAELNKIPLFFEDGWLPQLDPDAVLEEFTSVSHPILKTIIQAMTQKNMFQKRDYLERVEAPELAQFMADSPVVLNILDTAMRKMGFEGGIGLDVVNGKVEMDEGMEQLLSTNIPLLRTLGKVADGTIDALGLDDVVEQSTGRRDKYEGLEDLFQNMTYFFGAKFREEDEGYRAEEFAKEIQKKAEADRSAWKRTLPGYEQRSLQNQLQREAQRRRIGL